MKVSLCRLFARKVSKAVQFQPKITKLYEDFVGIEDLERRDVEEKASARPFASRMSEHVDYQNNDSADNIADEKENPASNRIRDVSSSKNAMAVVDPEAMAYLGSLSETSFSTTNSSNDRRNNPGESSSAWIKISAGALLARF